LIEKAGGFLQKIRTSLVYLCPAEHIPPKIEVDLTNLDIGDRVLMQDIPVHPALKLLSKNETMPVCKVLSSKPAE
jgi:large subunit ribosomal protein L25